MRLRARYNYNRDDLSEATGLDVPDDEKNRLTKQEFAEEVDINTILKRFNVTGHLPTGVRMPTYGDFEGIDNYQDALNAVREAGESFAAMPAEIRERFGNDPGKFVDFTANPDNRAEAERLGLVDPRPAPQAAPTPPPTPPTASTGGEAAPARTGATGDT